MAELPDPRVPAGERKLFVYGTLMRGQANAHHLRSARFLGAARTVTAFTLVWWQRYPGLRRGGDTAVRGELYLVSPEALADLDDFEGHPTLFRRQSIDLAGGGAAESYLVPPGAGEGAPVIAGGDFRRAGPPR